MRAPCERCAQPGAERGNVIMGIVGGTGTIIGPAVGAYFLILLGESLREIETFRILIYSAVMILCVMLFPRGLWGLGEALGRLAGARTSVAKAAR